MNNTTKTPALEKLEQLSKCLNYFNSPQTKVPIVNAQVAIDAFQIRSASILKIMDRSIKNLNNPGYSVKDYNFQDEVTLQEYFKRLNDQISILNTLIKASV